jgi:outer membrane protein assembly factor BamC
MFRVRLEAGMATGTTELYLTHRGVEEVAKGDNFVWQPRAADPELEAEMLNRMMVFFGVEDQRSKTLVAGEGGIGSRATLITAADGQSTLRIDEDFSRAWRRTGMALDRIGFAVEDRDRTNGLYFVHYEDPLGEQDKKGLLSSLKFWGDSDDIKKDKYQIHLNADGASTAVTVRNKDGNPENSSTATRILTLLEEQLK